MTHFLVVTDFDGIIKEIKWSQPVYLVSMHIHHIMEVFSDQSRKDLLIKFEHIVSSGKADLIDDGVFLSDTNKELHLFVMPQNDKLYVYGQDSEAKMEPQIIQRFLDEIIIKDQVDSKHPRETVRKQFEEIQQLNSSLVNMHRSLEKAKAQAEAANQAKSKFLATMNHEIRTPLNGMLGFLQLMEQTPLSDMQSEYTSYMNYSAQHLLSLVNNVLDMAKIEAGEMQLDHRSFDLAKTMETALTSLYPLAREKGLQLTIEYGPHLPDRLEGDPLRLRQIIMNLVSNALKFTEEGSVCVTIESLGSTGGFHSLHLEIRDTGPGMDQESQDKLFQPFYQIRDNHTAHPGGTGLGLSITRELVELMDGRIQVHSVVGTGSTFTVRLNLKEISEEVSRDHEENSPSPKPGPSYGIRRLLLVEDQKVNQALMKHRLAERGIAYDLAQNGKEAVEKAAHHSYDLILMDIQMPLLDGLEATRQIRSNTAVPQPRIVGMTAYATFKDQEDCLAAGMNGFLTKPFTAESLDRVLKNEETVKQPPDQTMDESRWDRKDQAMKALMKDTGMNEGEAWSLLQAFIKNGMDLVGESQEALEQSDHEKLVQTLHQMKGSPGNLYFPTIAAGVALAESCLKTGDHESLRSALQKIQENLTQLCREGDVDDKYKCYAAVE